MSKLFDIVELIISGLGQRSNYLGWFSVSCTNYHYYFRKWTSNSSDYFELKKHPNCAKQYQILTYYINTTYSIEGLYERNKNQWNCGKMMVIIQRQGVSALKITWIYASISVSHLLPLLLESKAKASGWHWDRDYPTCAIWLQTSTGCLGPLTNSKMHHKDKKQSTLIDKQIL